MAGIRRFEVGCGVGISSSVVPATQGPIPPWPCHGDAAPDLNPARWHGVPASRKDDGRASIQVSRADIRSRSRGAIRPKLCTKSRPSENRGRREDRVRAAPAVSCAMCAKRRAHEHTGSAGAFRPSLRSGFTAYFVLSPVNGFLATVAPEKLASQELDASTAASGPHDFAVRVMRLRLARTSRPPHPTARS